MPRAGRRVQQVINGADGKRGEEAPLVAEEPSGRAVGLLLRPAAWRRRGHAVLGVLFDRPVDVERIQGCRLVAFAGFSHRARPLAFPDLPPCRIEAALAMQQCDLRFQFRVERPHPLQHLLVYRVACRLRRHGHEDAVQPEPGRQHLGRRQCGLRLALPHRSLGDHQPRYRHRPRPLEQLPLRGPRGHLQPPRQRSESTFGNRELTPSTSQTEPLPRRFGPPAGRSEGDLPRIREPLELLAVTGDPVRHDDQPGQAQLLCLVQSAHRSCIGQVLKTDSPGEHVYDRPLRLLPPSSAPSAFPMPPLLQLLNGRKRPVMASNQRPNPCRALCTAPLRDQPRPQQRRARHVMPQPLPPGRRQPPPRQPRCPDRGSLRIVQRLEGRACLSAVVNPADPHEPQPPAPATDLLQPVPQRGRQVPAPHHLGHGGGVQQVPQQQMGPSPVPRRGLPPKPRHPGDSLLRQPHHPHQVNNRRRALHRCSSLPTVEPHHKPAH